MIDSRTYLNVALVLMFAASLAVPLANAQDRERGGPRGGPPQEAFDACVGLVENDPCSFSGDRGDAEGICVVPPRGEETLICAPSDGGPGLERRRDRDEQSDQA